MIEFKKADILKDVDRVMRRNYLPEYLPNHISANFLADISDVINLMMTQAMMNHAAKIVMHDPIIATDRMTLTRTTGLGGQE